MLLEHGVVVRDGNELVIAEALGVSDISQVRVTIFAELSDDQWFVKLPSME